MILTHLLLAKLPLDIHLGGGGGGIVSAIHPKQNIHSQLQKQNCLVSFCDWTLMLGSSASPACPCGLVWLKHRSIWTLKHQNRLKLWYKRKANLYRKWMAVYDVVVVVVFPLDLWLHWILVSTHTKRLTFVGAVSPASSSELTWLKQGSVSQCGSWGIRVLWYADMCKSDVTI